MDARCRDEHGHLAALDADNGGGQAGRTEGGVDGEREGDCRDDAVACADAVR